MQEKVRILEKKRDNPTEIIKNVKNNLILNLLKSTK